MTELVETLNYFLALGALFIQVATVALIVLYFTTYKETVAAFVSKWGLHLAFLLVLASSLMTLVYSEIFGFVPCGLCWLQRVFLYPMVIILGISLFKKGKEAIDYIIGLAIPGAIIALYQHYLQMGGTEFVNCPVATGADCAKRILFEFGYMTFPLMSFTTFIFLIVLLLYMRKTL